MLGNTSVNISHPAPGDWFLVAHLPPSSQKIQVKVRGLTSWDGGLTPLSMPGQALLSTT